MNVGERIRDLSSRKLDERLDRHIDRYVYINLHL